MTARPLPRRSVVEALRPPEGWFVAAAVGTTFGLDPHALVAALLALSGDDGESEDIEAQLAAVLRLRDRVRVFLHAGGMKAPSRPSQLHALVERVVEEVRLPGASFHPKVWVIELRPREAVERVDLARFRVICGSRNLTRARTWELAVQFEGSRAPKGRPSSAAADLTAFLRAVLNTSGSVPAAIRRMASVLPEVRFEAGPESRANLEFHWQWPRRQKSLGDLLPSRAKRILVISPFVNATFLRALEGAAPDIRVVSTQAQLDSIAARCQALMKQGFAFHVVRGRQEMPEQDALDLHAKVFLIETERTRRTILGSANATRAGFGLSRSASDGSDNEKVGRNAEAVVVLRPGLDRKSLEFGFLNRGMVVPWERSGAVEERNRKAVRALESLRDELLDTPFTSHWDRLRKTLFLRAGSRLPLSLGTTMFLADVRPIYLASDHAIPIGETASARGGSFSPVEGGQVSRFFAFTLVHRDSKEAISWVQGACLREDEDDRQERERGIQDSLLAGQSPMALVQRLLSAGRGTNGNSRPPSVHDGQHGAGRRRGRSAGASVSRDDALLLTLEQLLEACTVDEGLVPEIQRLVERWVERPPAADSPREADRRFAAFLRLWGAFQRATKRAGAPRG